MNLSNLSKYWMAIMLILARAAILPLHAQVGIESADIFSQTAKLEEYIGKYVHIDSCDYWRYFPLSTRLQKGDSSIWVSALKQDLILTGDLSVDADSTSLLFDTLTEDAVEKFQLRHGLKADGKVGRETLIELNRPWSVKIKELEKNKQHWKEFSEELSETCPSDYVWINIPEFRLFVVSQEETVLSMKVIVGKPSTPTPEINSVIQNIVFNPSWSIPDLILRKEIVPIQKRNSSYLKRNHIKLYYVRAGTRTEVDPDLISWKDILPTEINFIAVQDPGDWNALGKIKFVFENPYHIYLHDTPDKYLFNRPRRAFSHGCIRLENALELATWLFFEDRKSQHIAEVKTLIRKRGDCFMTSIPNPVPVYIKYFSSWVDKNNCLQFRNDMYDCYR